MTRTEYEAAVCSQLRNAKTVDFKKVSLRNWVPVVSECHTNVNRWVEGMPWHRAVRGWVVYKQCIIGVNFGLELTAHSVVRDEIGDLFDISPISDERPRAGGFMRFVEHAGTEALFWELESANRFICCPNCS